MSPNTRPASARLASIQLSGKVSKFQQFVLDYFEDQGLMEKFEDYLDEIEVFPPSCVAIDIIVCLCRPECFLDCFANLVTFPADVCFGSIVEPSR